MTLSQCTASSYISSRLITKKFEYSDTKKISIEIEYSTLTIEPSLSSSVKVIYSYPKKNSSEIEYYSQNNEAELVIKERIEESAEAYYPGYLTLQIPVGIELGIVTKSTSIYLMDVTASVRVLAEQGKINVHGGNSDLWIDSDSANITIKLDERFNNSITAHSNSGNITLITSHVPTSIITYSPIFEGPEMSFQEDMILFGKRWLKMNIIEGTQGTISLFGQDSLMDIKKAGTIF